MAEHVKNRTAMEQGRVYNSGDPELMQGQLALMEKMYDFNQTRPSEQEKRQMLLREMLAECGEGCYVEPPFYANWGGAHVHFGNHVYANFGLTCVDDTDIYVGDAVLFAPHVTIATANHPVWPTPRDRGWQYNKPVTIGRNVWIGSGAVVVPGVTIGENSVIGAGSVVTRDIPPNVVAVGNPCRVLREISEHDREYFFHDQRIDWDEIAAISAETE